MCRSTGCFPAATTVGVEVREAVCTWQAPSIFDTLCDKNSQNNIWT